MKITNGYKTGTQTFSLQPYEKFLLVINATYYKSIGLLGCKLYNIDGRYNFDVPKNNYTKLFNSSSFVIICNGSLKRQFTIEWI
jgi:hypothetical protein